MKCTTCGKENCECSSFIDHGEYTEIDNVE